MQSSLGSHALIAGRRAHRNLDGNVTGPDGKPVRVVDYWYGMSSGVIDIRYAPGLPYQTRKLVQLLRNGIVVGSINPWRAAPLPRSVVLSIPYK